MGFWKNLGQALAKGVISVAVAEFISRQLNKLIKNQIINNAVKLVIFLVAILISHLSLFGEGASLLASSVIILGLLLHSVIKTVPKILLLIEYIPESIFKIISESKTPSELLANYLRRCHPLIFILKAKADEKLQGWIPSADDLVDYVWGYLGKQILIFAITLGLFIVSFNFIAKPMLQSAVMGVSGIKTYFVPFAMAIDYIFKTQTMQWLAG
jgi:ABC-type transport system involved in cytochrome bd biosynthesis fused ATPase/permease subunit